MQTQIGRPKGFKMPDPSAADRLEGLLDTILSISQDPRVIAAADSIAELCTPFLEPDQSVPGVEYGLKPAETRILGLLLKRRGQIVSREALLVCGSLHDDNYLKTLDVHICRIRRRLEGTKYGGMIETIWGRGYRLRTETEGAAEVRAFTGRNSAAKFYSPAERRVA